MAILLNYNCAYARDTICRFCCLEFTLVLVTLQFLQSFHFIWDFKTCPVQRIRNFADEAHQKCKKREAACIFVWGLWKKIFIPAPKKIDSLKKELGIFLFVRSDKFPHSHLPQKKSFAHIFNTRITKIAKLFGSGF